MKTLYLDLSYGFDAEAIISALVCLGLDESILRSEALMLNFGCSVEFVDVKKNGVLCKSASISPIAAEASCRMKLVQLLESLDSYPLPDAVRDASRRVFTELADAEATVSGVTQSSICFNVSDATAIIICVMCFIMCEKILGIKKIIASVPTDHNTHPAVMQILVKSGIPFYQSARLQERTASYHPHPSGQITPLGMGIIKTIITDYGLMPQMDILAVGYGTSVRQPDNHILRAVLGETSDTQSTSALTSPIKEELTLLETNIDDMSSELLGYCCEKLLGLGALDVYVTPIYMKKNRPAHTLTVLTKTEEYPRYADFILRETSTLGIRVMTCDRLSLPRSFETVTTRYGDVRLKVSHPNGYKKCAAEYEDCKRLAEKNNVPLRCIYDAVAKVLGIKEMES